MKSVIEQLVSGLFLITAVRTSPYTVGYVAPLISDFVTAIAFKNITAVGDPLH
jgi:hypothetical protein